MSQAQFREVQSTAKRRRRNKKIIPLVVLYCAAVGFYFLAVHLGFFRKLDLRAYDQFLRLRNRIASPTVPLDIVVVAIDEASMKEIGIPWPWPRGLHGELVSKLTDAGASIIAFDVLFLDPTNDGDDLAFAAAMKRAGNVVLGEDFVVEENATYREKIWTGRTTWVRPLDAFLDSAAGSGLVKVVRDPDNFVRRAYMDMAGIPSMDRVVAERFLRSSSPAGRAISVLALPEGPDRPVLINYLGPPHSVPTVSYFEALEPAKYLPRGFFEHKIILIGRALAGAADLSTPDYFAYPFLSDKTGPIAGVEIHASLIDTLLRHRFLVPVRPAVQAAVFCLFLALSAIALASARHWQPPVAFSGLMLLYAGGLYAAFHVFSRVADLATPLLVCAAFFVAERAYTIIVIDREKRFVQKAIKHYVSPIVVDLIAENPDLLSLYGERFETTVVFTDLVGFTSISERMEPM